MVITLAGEFHFFAMCVSDAVIIFSGRKTANWADPPFFLLALAVVTDLAANSTVSPLVFPVSKGVIRYNSPTLVN